MKMRLIFSLVFLGQTCFNANVWAQVPVCGTIVSGDQITLENGINIPSVNANESLPILDLEMAVTVYIIKNETGATTISISDVQSAIDRLNLSFSPIKLRFRICETKYVDNYLLDAIDMAGNINELLIQYYNPKTINLYFSTDIKDLYGTQLNGYAMMPAEKQEAVFLTKNQVSGNEVIHQFGHFFNLYHTHETVFGKEFVNGANCHTTGDHCCDTPADPVLIGSVSGACEYTGTAKDTNGQFYIPGVHNYMSFTNDACRCFFTNDQFMRIVNCVRNFKTDLW
jgi:hypothetical protein